MMSYIYLTSGITDHYKCEYCIMYWEKLISTENYMHLVDNGNGEASPEDDDLGLGSSVLWERNISKGCDGQKRLGGHASPTPADKRDTSPLMCNF